MLPLTFQRLASKHPGQLQTLFLETFQGSVSLCNTLFNLQHQVQSYQAEIPLRKLIWARLEDIHLD